MRRQQHLRQPCRIVRGDVLGNDEKVQLAERVAHAVRIGQADGGVRAHHPQRLDPTVGDRVEHLNGLEPLPRHEVRRLPEAADAITLGFREVHVRGEHVG